MKRLAYYCLLVFPLFVNCLPIEDSKLSLFESNQFIYKIIQKLLKNVNGYKIFDIPEATSYEMYNLYSKHGIVPNESPPHAEDSSIWYVHGLKWKEYTRNDYEKSLGKSDTKLKNLVKVIPGFYTLSIDDTNIYEGYEEYFHI